MSKMVLSIKEVAERAGISESNVRQLIRERKITASKLGKEWRIPSDEIDRLLGINSDKEYFKKDIYIKELEGKVKNYEIQLKAFKNIVSSLSNVISD